MGSEMCIRDRLSSLGALGPLATPIESSQRSDHLLPTNADGDFVLKGELADALVLAPLPVLIGLPHGALAVLHVARADDSVACVKKDGAQKHSRRDNAFEDSDVFTQARKVDLAKTVSETLYVQYYLQYCTYCVPRRHGRH